MPDDGLDPQHAAAALLAGDRRLDPRPLELRQELRQRVLLGHVDQDVLEFATRRIGHFNHREIDPVGLHPSGTQRVVGPEHRETITVVRESQPH